MVILVTCEETDKRTKQKRIVVSHGYDINTGKNIVIPPVPPNEIGIFSSQIGEWILR